MLDSTFHSNSWIIDDTEISYYQHTESFSQYISSDEGKPLHSHSYYEMLISRSDNCQLFFLDKSIPLYNGTTIILHPRYMHCAKVNQPKDLLSVGFNFQYKKRTILNREIFETINKNLAPNAYIVIPPLYNFLSEFSEIEKLNFEYNAFQSEIVFSVFIKVLFNILSILENDNSNNQIISQPYLDSNKGILGIRASDSSLKLIDHILHKEFKTQVTVADVSKRVYLSERQINRYIMNQYSQTFEQRKTQLRINLACSLLMKTTQSILEISQTVGYLSINTFYSAFKKQTGMTPSEFRIHSSNKNDLSMFV